MNSTENIENTFTASGEGDCTPLSLLAPDGKVLKPFQTVGVRTMLSFLQWSPDHSCYNAHVMGLGKTIQTIVALNTLAAKHERKYPAKKYPDKKFFTLVICPAVMRGTWEKEIRTWCTYLPTPTPQPITSATYSDSSDVVVWYSGQDVKDYQPAENHRFLVTSYNLLSTKAALDKLVYLCGSKQLHLTAMVMDEAHYLKDSRSKRSKAVLKTLWPKTGYRIALSGTPFTTAIVDGYTMFHRMYPAAFPDFDSFVREYSYMRTRFIGTRSIPEYFGVKNAEKLSKIIRSHFYLRCTLQQAAIDLPERIFTEVTLPIKYAIKINSNTEKEQLEAEAEMMRRAIEADKIPPCPPHIAKHRRLQGLAKVKPVIEYVESLLEANEPGADAIVIGAYHTDVLHALRDHFKKLSPSYIDGSVIGKDRQKQIDRFQNGETPLFIGQLTAAGVGITLTRASVCVLAEMDWSPAVVSQFIARLHRIGQKNIVRVTYFVVDRSLDETITNMVISRAKVFKSVLD